MSQRSSAIKSEIIIAIVFLYLSIYKSDNGLPGDNICNSRDITSMSERLSHLSV